MIKTGLVAYSVGWASFILFGAAASRGSRVLFSDVGLLRFWGVAERKEDVDVGGWVFFFVI